MKGEIRVHCFQQVPEEGLGCILDWIEANGHALSYTRFYEEESLPELDSFEMLIVMGGPMSVYEEEKYPWLRDQKRLIKQAVEAGKVVLGICLGSQFIASALGAKVYPGAKKEIGWFPLQTTEIGDRVLKIPQGQAVFHWHGDTFDLPKGAELLASSLATPHQGFIVGDRVLALQFHLEVNASSLEAMTRSFADELVEDTYVQSAEFIRAQQQVLAQNNQLMATLLDGLMTLL